MLGLMPKRPRANTTVSSDPTLLANVELSPFSDFAVVERLIWASKDHARLEPLGTMLKARAVIQHDKVLGDPGGLGRRRF